MMVLAFPGGALKGEQRFNIWGKGEAPAEEGFFRSLADFMKDKAKLLSDKSTGAGDLIQRIRSVEVQIN